jgi:hypothetical protein
MNQGKRLDRRGFRALCVLLALAQAFPLFAMQNQSSPSSSSSVAAQRVAEEVTKLPIGGKLTVLKTDGTEYHGHLQEIGAQDFSFMEVDLRQPLTLSYSEVQRVSKDYGGKGIGGQRIHHPRRGLVIGAAILGTLFVVLIVALARDKS